MGFTFYGIFMTKTKFVKRIIILVLIIGSVYLVLNRFYESQSNEITKGLDCDTLKLNYDKYLAEYLEEDNGTGCGLPYLNPFYHDQANVVENLEFITCGEPDWVKCRFSTCKLQPWVLKSMNQILCIYQDILHMSDKKYKLGSPIHLNRTQEYILRESDHVRIYCSASKISEYGLFWKKKSWVGFASGLRLLKQKPSPTGRENSINVLIVALDSISKNQFLCMLPKSYRFIVEKLNATVLNKYNILASGTKEAIIPILSGKRYFELKEARKSFSDKPFDPSPLIFHKLAADGYTTAYFEDMPDIGTFNYAFNGFPYQPTDHYLFSFCSEVKRSDRRFCIGDTPQFKVFLDLTDQLIQLKGKKFVFSFIADISHDSPALVPNVDKPLVNLLKGILRRENQRNTLIIIMGDHGQRFGNARRTYQGSLEERLPFMAIRLPEVLRQRLPGAQSALEMNAEVLTTPHDIHTTLLDAIDLTQHIVNYKVKGASMPRGLSLLKPIPQTRSCSEAGITPFWCSCIEWEELNATDPMYERTGHALLTYINSQTLFLRARCAVRTLTSIDWVKKGCVRKYVPNKKHFGVKDESGRFFVKITVGPGHGVFESVVKYESKINQMVINPKGISRTSKYSNEPACISSKYPHLNNYCYCI